MDVRAKVTIYPEADSFADIAKDLLAVADHPRDVAYVSSPRAGFIVSEELFERFENARGDLAPWQTELPEGSQREDTQLKSVDPPKRRPGRPRKNLLTPEELQAAIAAGSAKSDPSKEE